MSLPEFGQDAFVNPDFEGSADLYAKKGPLILRVSMPRNFETFQRQEPSPSWKGLS